MSTYDLKVNNKKIKFNKIEQPQQQVKPKPFIGLYRDIIHYIDEDVYEIREIQQNDVLPLFGKYIQFILSKNNHYFLRSETDDFLQYKYRYDVNIINDQYQKLLRSIYQQDQSSQYNTIIHGIHSWDVSIGLDEYDSQETESDIVQQYKSKTQQYLQSQEGVFVDKTNSLQFRFSNSWEQERTTKQQQNQSQDVQQFQFRKPVYISFQVPSSLLYGDNLQVSTDVERNIYLLRTGQQSLSNVIEWSVSTHLDNIFPEFILVEQTFEPNEQNFMWRDFQLQQNLNFSNTYQIPDELKQSYTTNQQNLFNSSYINGSLEQYNEPNRPLIVNYPRNSELQSELNEMVMQNNDLQKQENQQLVHPHGTYIDYKVHTQFQKTSNMRVTRQIIFQFIQILDTFNS